MTLTITELRELLAILYPQAGADALARIETRLDALAGKVDALTGQIDKENTTLATTDEQISVIGADVKQVISLYAALKTDDEQEAAQLAAMRQALADAQTADGADSPRAKALQAIVDALTPILTPAAPAPPAVTPAPAPAPATPAPAPAPDAGTPPAGDSGPDAGAVSATPVPVPPAPVG